MGRNNWERNKELSEATDKLIKEKEQEIRAAFYKKFVEYRDNSAVVRLCSDLTILLILRTACGRSTSRRHIFAGIRRVYGPKVFYEGIQNEETRNV